MTGGVGRIIVLPFFQFSAPKGSLYLAGFNIQLSIRIALAKRTARCPTCDAQRESSISTADAVQHNPRLS